MKKLFLLLVLLLLLSACGKKEEKLPKVNYTYNIVSDRVDMSAYEGVSSTDHHFRIVKVQEFFNTVDNKSSGIFYLGRTNCGCCQKVCRYLNEVAKELNQTVYYIDVYNENEPLTEKEVQDQLFEYLFEILGKDENGNKTGVVRERGVAHRDGSRHGTVHTWIARKNEAGEIELLLQKRSDTKDSHPGCYDISSAGHIGHGEEPEDAAIRELREELGISLKQEDLTFLGTRRGFDDTVSHGFPFRDNEINYEYVTTVPVSDTMLRPDPAEVSGVLWLPLSKCLSLIKTQEIPHCLAGDELLLLQNHFSH